MTADVRSRRYARAAAITRALAADLTVHIHRPEWSQHPIPWCAACPAGDTWPCPHIYAAARRAHLDLRTVTA